MMMCYDSSVASLPDDSDDLSDYSDDVSVPSDDVSDYSVYCLILLVSF